MCVRFLFLNILYDMSGIIKNDMYIKGMIMFKNWYSSLFVLNMQLHNIAIIRQTVII